MATLISKELLVNGIKKCLHGFVPVYKPAGMCCLKLSEALRLDVYFVLEHHDVSYGQILMSNVRFLEPFASGLVTFVLGKGLEKRKNFALANYVYDAVIEFGVEREFHCLDGPVIGKSNISGVNATSIREALPDFVGNIAQDRCGTYRICQNSNRDPLQLLESGDIYKDSELNHIDMMNQIILPSAKSKVGRVPQKYPYVWPKRSMSVESIELINYREPYGEFKISCQGSYSVRQFAIDLAKKLGSKASLVSLSRVKEGPIELDDLRVLQPHEVHLDYYLHRLPSLYATYKDFNKEFDQLWEDIAT